MNLPAKFSSVNYPLSTILLILAAIYLYFLSPFKGIVFFPVFFAILALISLTHPYALIITEKQIIYKPFPVFSKKITDISLIKSIQKEAGKVMIITEKNNVTVKKYFLKNNQWKTVVSYFEQLPVAFNQF
jgi:hypothetical protein